MNTRLHQRHTQIESYKRVCREHRPGWSKHIVSSKPCSANRSLDRIPYGLRRCWPRPLSTKGTESQKRLRNIKRLSFYFWRRARFIVLMRTRTDTCRLQEPCCDDTCPQLCDSDNFPARSSNDYSCWYWSQGLPLVKDGYRRLLYPGQ